MRDETTTDGTAAAWGWLESRGLDVELLATMGFTAGDLSGVPHVSIPYIRDGGRYLAKYRPANSDKRFHCRPSGVSKSLFNVDALRAHPSLPVVITEGEFDAASCIQSGWMRSVSIPDGWSEQLDEDAAQSPGAKMQPLIEVEAELRAAPFVIIASDADKVGAAFVRAMVAFLEGCDVRSCRWPEGCKDPNDVLRIHGPAVLNERLLAAEQVDPPGASIYALDELPPMDSRRVLRTGQRTLDRFAAFEIGAISVLTGVPGAGKTTFATFIADQVRRHEGVRVGIAAFETHPHRIRDHLARIDGAAWDDLRDLDRASLSDWFRIVRRREFSVESEAHDMIWLRQMIRTLAVRDQCKLIVVDPWNEIEHAPAPGENMTAYVNLALTRLRQWAEMFDCHVLLVAHPRKMPADRAHKAPTGYDVADSAAFFNKPALGLSIRQRVDDETSEARFEVVAWKVRDRELYGVAPGSTTLEFDARKLVYRETMGSHH